MFAELPESKPKKARRIETMLLYTTLGTNDTERAIRFYDPVMAVLGHVRLKTVGKGAGYGPALYRPGTNECCFWIEEPYMKLPATWGNGTMIALIANTRQQVDDFYTAALANGGIDEGAPGLRPYHASFYACYVRDPDGNKLSAVCEAEV